MKLIMRAWPLWAGLALAGLAVMIFHYLAVWHWFVHVSGSDYGFPYGHFVFYDFESGSGSDLAEFAIIGSVFTLVATLLRKHNCEVHGCWRLGRHATAAGHVVCRKHHPDDKLTAVDVIVAHHAALAKERARG